MKLLVVEDDLTTLDYIRKGFQEQGFTVDVAEDGQEGFFLASSGQYDLIVLDRMLPKMDGMALLAGLRASQDRTPIILLSALSHVDERIKGLQAGGNDYLTKPFSFQELLIRAQNLLQQQAPVSTQETTLSIANLKMDLIGHKVKRGGTEIKLQPKEFQLLRYLLEHQGQVISRTLLFERVWEYHFDPKTNVIDVHIAKLRKKLEVDGQSQLIHTVRGAGYVIRES